MWALQFEKGVNQVYYPDAEACWNLFTTGFGPVRALANRLEGDALKSYRDDFLALFEESAAEFGLHIQRDFSLVIGTRN